MKIVNKFLSLFFSTNHNFIALSIINNVLFKRLFIKIIFVGIYFLICNDFIFCGDSNPGWFDSFFRAIGVSSPESQKEIIKGTFALSAFMFSFYISRRIALNSQKNADLPQESITSDRGIILNEEKLSNAVDKALKDFANPNVANCQKLDEQMISTSTLKDMNVAEQWANLQKLIEDFQKTPITSFNSIPQILETFKGFNDNLYHIDTFHRENMVYLLDEIILKAEPLKDFIKENTTDVEVISKYDFILSELNRLKISLHDCGIRQNEVGSFIWVLNFLNEIKKHRENGVELYRHVSNLDINILEVSCLEILQSSSVSLQISIFFINMLKKYFSTDCYLPYDITKQYLQGDIAKFIGEFLAEVDIESQLRQRDEG
jgi:hypothetical protein